MPVTFSFDIEGAPPVEHNRVQSFLERLGWQHLGGSSYQYPRLGTDKQPVEDWFNHVAPALMHFRAYVLRSGRRLKKFSLQAQSSSAPTAKNSLVLRRPAAEFERRRRAEKGRRAAKSNCIRRKTRRSESKGFESGLMCIGIHTKWANRVLERKHFLSCLAGR